MERQASLSAFTHGCYSPWKVVLFPKAQFSLSLLSLGSSAAGASW